MIVLNHLAAPLWRQIQRQNFIAWESLCDFLELEEHKRACILKRPSFPLNLPRRLALKIKKNCLNDPILKQFLPTLEEEKETFQFLQDPVGDFFARKGKKLLHKYRGRALLLTSSACAMHCRFCFRQNFPYESEDRDFEEELMQIAKDETLSEIILSGGDPLSLSNRVLKDLIQKLETIPHLKRLRFHSRFPIGIPERIDSEFLEILEQSCLQIFFVIHTNCSKELDEEILTALKKIQKLGIPLLNHSVLLKGINDSVEAQQELLSTLIDNGIIPYYLNQLDRVQGAAHFEVEEERGLELIRQLRAILPGYAIPEYVREYSGEPNKIPLRENDLHI